MQKSNFFFIGDHLKDKFYIYAINIGSLKLCNEKRKIIPLTLAT